jgi:hypothetical protein
MRLARSRHLGRVKAINCRALEKTKLHISSGLVIRHVGGPPARKTLRGGNQRVNKLWRCVDLDRVLYVRHFFPSLSPMAGT